MITSIVHCNIVRTYLNHRAKIHDMIQTMIVKQIENEVAKYNREMFKMNHCSDDLMLL